MAAGRALSLISHLWCYSCITRTHNRAVSLFWRPQWGYEGVLCLDLFVWEYCNHKSKHGSATRDVHCIFLTSWCYIYNSWWESKLATNTWIRYSKLHVVNRTRSVHGRHCWHSNLGTSRCFWSAVCQPALAGELNPEDCQKKHSRFDSTRAGNVRESSNIDNNWLYS